MSRFWEHRGLSWVWVFIVLRGTAFCMSSSSQVQWGGIAITSTTNVALLILGLQGVRLMCWITFRCSTVTQQIERKHFYSQLWMETVLLEARFWEFQCDLTGSIFVSAKGLFGVSELNTCCAALTNTNPYTRNRKYYDVVQNLGKGDWGWGGKPAPHSDCDLFFYCHTWMEAALLCWSWACGPSPTAPMGLLEVRGIRVWLVLC